MGQTESKLLGLSMESWWKFMNAFVDPLHHEHARDDAEQMIILFLISLEVNDDFKIDPDYSDSLSIHKYFWYKSINMLEEFPDEDYFGKFICDLFPLVVMIDAGLTYQHKLAPLIKNYATNLYQKSGIKNSEDLESMLSQRPGFDNFQSPEHTKPPVEELYKSPAPSKRAKLQRDPFKSPEGFRVGLGNAGENHDPNVDDISESDSDSDTDFGRILPGKDYKVLSSLMNSQVSHLSVVRNIKTKEKLIMKENLINSAFGNTGYYALKSEVRIFKKLGTHPNVIQMHDYWTSPQQIFMIIDYMQGGSLHDYIAGIDRPVPENLREIWVSQRNVMAVDRVWLFIAQISSALKYIEEVASICHSDMKPDNILLAVYKQKNPNKQYDMYKSHVLLRAEARGEETKISRVVFKLTDFGVSYNYDVTVGTMGDPRYLPPLGKKETKNRETIMKQDIYGVGKMAQEIMF